MKRTLVSLSRTSSVSKCPIFCKGGGVEGGGSEPIMSLQTFGFNSILGGGGWSSEFQCPIVQFSQVPPVNGGGCHNWEKNFIDFLHVSQHIDHF